MIWIIIIAVIVIIMSKFFYDRNQQATKIVKEGGMKKKYSKLIDYLLSGDSRAKIYYESPSSITLGASSIGGTVLFILTQTFGKLTVQWKFDSPVLGNHKIEWDFPEYDDHEKMIERIANDLLKYQKNMMQNFM
jgi:hypothetical protein